MIVALFEDEVFENFLPLTYTRPVFELRSGMFSFLERVERVFHGHRVLLFTREYLVPTLKRRFHFPINDLEAVDDDVLLVNGALIVNDETKQLIRKKLRINVAITQMGSVILAHINKKIVKKWMKELCKPVTCHALKRMTKECKVLKSRNLPLMKYPWDLVNNCAKLIVDDFATLSEKKSVGTVDDRAALYGDENNVFVGKDSSVEAFVTLDIRNGPIYIGRNVIVQSGSRISGPTFIGNETIIASGLIRGGCSIGRVCRVGGELEKTIVQGFTNKYHTGYIGHAYVGEWVNIGAATTNSNLKNTYGTVQVTVKGKKVDTRQVKVGCFISDHAKTSIGTQIYTGIKIGVASHVHGFITEDVPSFTVWAKSLGAKPVELYLKSAIETQKRVMSRRGIKQTNEDVELLEKIFKVTKSERREAGVVKKKLEL